MHWYVIPIFLKENTFYVPGVGDPVVTEAVISTNFLVHAASPKPAPTSALLGVATEPTPTPAGWVAKTLAEAQAYFESVTGRAPTAQEVF